MNNTSAWKNLKSTIATPIDPWLFFAMLAIYIMSLFLLYSADGQEFGQLENKTIHTVLGFALLWIIAVFKPQTAAKVALPVYIVGVLLLIGVEVAGVTVNGSTRWLSLGFTRIQPSEIMKIGIPMTVAWYFQRYEGRLKWIHYIVALVLILVPVSLIFEAARPRYGSTDYGFGHFCHLFCRIALESHFCRYYCLCGRPAALMELRHARLPENPRPHPARPNQRPVRRRLPHHPIHDCHRLGRRMG